MLATMPSLTLVRSLAATALLAATVASAARDGPLLGGNIAAPARDAVHARLQPASEMIVRHGRASRSLLPTLAEAHRSGDAREFEIGLLPTFSVRARVVDVETTASGGIAVIAKVLEEGGGNAVLVQNGTHIVGSVNFVGGAYLIETVDGSVESIAKLLPHLLPSELPPVPVPSTGVRDESAPTEAAPGDPPMDSGRLIDLLVVYTQGARNEAGGADSTVIQGRIDLGVAETNAAYLNSGVAQRVRLVHREEVTYTEAGNIGTDLNRLTSTSDGLLDSVHALRNTHGADLVKLVVGGPSGCGVAWLLNSLVAGTPANGFSVTLWTCISPNYTFGHELGHNMGLMHDPYTVNKYSEGTGPAAYGYGFVDLVRRYRTVMSYNDQCGDPPNSFFCTRHLIFSNPRFAFDPDGSGAQPSAVMGTAGTNHNAHVLNKTAKLIAAYRPTSPLHPVPQRFTDVASGHPFYGHIEFLAQAGVTSGCATGLYCLDMAVTRRQMAVFVERTLRASNWTPPPATGLFTDVPPGAQFRDYIEALRNDAITSGCTTTTYCPDDPVTRAQMAVFVLRTMCGAAYVPNMPAVQRFTDVAPTHAFYRFIDKMAALGITSGCSVTPARYCPDDAVTRSQMAVFLERSFPLKVPTEACSL